MGGDVGFWKIRGSGMLHKDVCVFVRVGAKAETGAGQTKGPRGSCIVPPLPAVSPHSGLLWWMRC